MNMIYNSSLDPDTGYDDFDPRDAPEPEPEPEDEHDDYDQDHPDPDWYENFQLEKQALASLPDHFTTEQYRAAIQAVKDLKKAPTTVCKICGKETGPAFGMCSECIKKQDQKA